MNKRRALWLLLGVLVICIAIRSYELTARSLWFDEAFSWRLIQFGWIEMFERAAADVHPPLYYMVLKVWNIVFGSSLLALRSFSVVAGALTAAAVYLFTASAARSRATGVLAALIFAVSGWQVAFAWEARMYTLGTALSLLSSWLLLSAIRNEKRWLLRSGIDKWILYGIVTSAFAYIHYYALFSLAAHAVFALGWVVYQSRGRLGELLYDRNVWGGLLAVGCTLALYAPWVPVFLQQNAQVQEQYWIPDIGGWSIPDTFYRMMAPTAGIPRHDGLGWILVAVLPLAVVLLGWVLLALPWWRGRISADARFLVLLSGIVPFALSIGLSFISQSLYQDRFFVFANLYLLIATAFLISAIPHPPTRRITSALVVIGLVATSALYWNSLAITEKSGAHAAARYVLTEATVGEPVLVSSPFVYFAILHYAQEEFGIETPQLLSADGQLAHFAGGPILTQADVVGPDVFESAQSLWMIDTTGFGGALYELPEGWQQTQQRTYAEVFPHQGDVFATRYERN